MKRVISSRECIRPPMEITLASLCSRARAAVWLAPDERGPHAAHLVGGDLLAVAGSTDHDADAALVGHDRLGRAEAEHRVVVLGVVPERPMVDRVVSLVAQPADQVVLELEAGVIRTQVDAHGRRLVVIDGGRRGCPWFRCVQRKAASRRHTGRLPSDANAAMCVHGPRRPRRTNVDDHSVGCSGMLSPMPRSDRPESVERRSRQAWTIWVVGLLVYMLAVFHRSSLAVAGLAAADRFDIAASAARHVHDAAAAGVRRHADPRGPARRPLRVPQRAPGRRDGAHPGAGRLRVRRLVRRGAGRPGVRRPRRRDDVHLRAAAGEHLVLPAPDPVGHPAHRRARAVRGDPRRHTDDVGALAPGWTRSYLLAASFGVVLVVALLVVSTSAGQPVAAWPRCR